MYVIIIIQNMNVFINIMQNMNGISIMHNMHVIIVMPIIIMPIIIMNKCAYYYYAEYACYYYYAEYAWY